MHIWHPEIFNVCSLGHFLHWYKCGPRVFWIVRLTGYRIIGKNIRIVYVICIHYCRKGALSNTKNSNVCNYQIISTLFYSISLQYCINKRFFIFINFVMVVCKILILLTEKDHLHLSIFLNFVNLYFSLLKNRGYLWKIIRYSLFFYDFSV